MLKTRVLPWPLECRQGFYQCLITWVYVFVGQKVILLMPFLLCNAALQKFCYLPALPGHFLRLLARTFRLFSHFLQYSPRFPVGVSSERDKNRDDRDGTDPLLGIASLWDRSDPSLSVLKMSHLVLVCNADVLSAVLSGRTIPL